MISSKSIVDKGYTYNINQNSDITIDIKKL